MNLYLPDRAITSIFFLLLAITCSSQRTITINFPKNTQLDRYDVFDLSQREIKEGKFSDTIQIGFKTSESDSYWLRFYLDSKMYKSQIWLDSGNIEIDAKITEAGLVIDTVKNSPIYYQSLAFAKEMSRLSKDSAAAKSFLKERFIANRNNILSQLVAMYWSSYSYNDKPDMIEFSKLWESSSTDFSWFLLYTPISEKIKAALNKEPLSLTSTVFQDSSGRMAHIEKGKYLYFLDFWFSACLPCLKDHQLMKEHIKELENADIRVIGISTDDSFITCRDHLRKSKYPWLNLLQTQTDPFTTKAGISTFPSYLILDSDGNILAAYDSFEKEDFKLH